MHIKDRDDVSPGLWQANVSLHESEGHASGPLFTPDYITVTPAVSYSKPNTLNMNILGLIYETNVRPKFGRTVVSTQNLEFINMDVSGGYDQISRQVWACVRKFLS